MTRSFLGRSRELEAAGELMGRAEAGRGGLMMLVGEPGIGKSRLADAVALEAERRGFRVGFGRAWEAGGAPVYFPWAQALAALGLAIPDASHATAVDSEAARLQLALSVARDLGRAAGVTPILIVLDDLHVADASSLRMLELVARELIGMRAVVVGTRRDADPAMTREVESVLNRIARSGTSFVLGRLGRDDVVRLVETDGPRIPPELRAAIFESTLGNPLFVGEVVRLLDADPSRAAGGAVPLPSGAREILGERLGRLDASTREILEIASVVGVEFEHTTVREVCARSDDAVGDAAEIAIRAGIAVSAGERRSRFAHALYRDAVYFELPRARRAELHAAVADALERVTPSARMQIAHHAIEAGPRERLVERLQNAALALAGAHADEDAVRMLERALAVLTADARGRGEIALLLALAKMRSGDLSGGRAAARIAVDAGRALADASLLARGALAHAFEVTQGQTDADTHALLEEALARVEAGPETALRVRLEARLASSLQPARDPESVARLALRAVNEARTLGDEQVLLDVLHDAGGAFGEAVFSLDAVEMAKDAVRLAIRRSDRGKLFRARIRLIFGYMELGDLAGADANIEALDAEARATGQARYMWPAPLFRAMRAMQEGRFADADALREEASEIGASDPLAKTSVMMQYLARLRVGERAAELLALEPRLLAVIAHWNDARVYADLMTGLLRSFSPDTEAARAHLARVSFDSTPGRIRLAFGSLADASLRAGDVERADAFYQRLLPDEDRWLVYMFGGFAADATYARLLGGFATLSGRFDRAERHFETALAIAEAASARPEIARVLAAFGSMLLRRNRGTDRERANELAARAREIAEELGLELTLRSLPAGLHAEPPKQTKKSESARELRCTSEGETWLFELGDQTLRLKDSRGLGYIARLLAEPGREIHVLDLGAASDAIDAGDAGAVLDAEARAAYQRRLADLDEEEREAEALGDGARKARARSEIELLAAELARAVGLGGRERRSGSNAERARVAVTRRIREVIRRAEEQTPEIGRYLDATIKTGMYCVYRTL